MFKSLGRLLFSTRIQTKPAYGCQQISTQIFPLQFRASPCLLAEPLKKKKKIDPAIIKAREDRRRRKIMKEIRKLKKLDKQLKPIDEFEVPQCLKDDYESRKREVIVPDNVAEERILLLKKYTKMKFREDISDNFIITRLMKSQKKALDELRLESEELYQAAVRIDENLIPLKYFGPSETPAKDDYRFPDGAYIDESRKW